MTISFDQVQIDAVAQIRAAALVPLQNLYELEDVQTVPEDADRAIVVGIVGVQPLADLLGDFSDWRATLRVRVIVRDNRRPSAAEARPVWGLAAAVHGAVWQYFGIGPGSGQIGASLPRITPDSDERDTRIGVVDLSYDLTVRASPQTLEYVPT